MDITLQGAKQIHYSIILQYRPTDVQHSHPTYDGLTAQSSRENPESSKLYTMRISLNQIAERQQYSD